MTIDERLTREKQSFQSVHLPIREDWLATTREEAIEPEMTIVDAHHHLWGTPRPDYLLPEFLADTAGGHRIVASIFVECRTMYRAGGPERERSLGETEFANGVAAMAASGVFGETRVCDGIVGYVDLGEGETVRDLLEKHVAVSSGRFVGVRNINAHHDDPEVITTSKPYPKDLLVKPSFHAGARVLGEMGLCFDAFMYHPQLRDIAVMAKACPDTRIIIDHYGCPVGVGPYRGKREEVFAEWSATMKELARHPNISVKLGGLTMRTVGFEFEKRETAPGSDEMARAWQPYFDHMIDCYGPQRCMFESNFPVDKGACGYTVLWNTFKKMSRHLSADERAWLFERTARSVYGLSA